MSKSRDKKNREKEFFYYSVIEKINLPVEDHTPPDGAVAEGRSYDLPFLFVLQSHSICFLTSDIFSRNSLIPLTLSIRKALHRSFRSDDWIKSQTVVGLSFWSGRFYASVPAASGREPRSESGQRKSECPLHRWSRGLA